MKKYLVSLALKVPCNFEVNVNANSEKRALKSALTKWQNKINCKNVTEPEWEELELDIENSNNINKLGNGICIQEL